MDTPPPLATVPIATPKDVIGISRSGRLRIKSSKLMDFQSPDDIEKSKNTVSTNVTLIQRPKGSLKKQGRGRPPKLISNQRQIQSIGSTKTTKDIDDDFDIHDADIEKTLNEIAGDEDLEKSYLDYDKPPDSEVHQSLYMNEKPNMKQVLREGKVVYKKSHRKDKGNTRITAFLLWVRETKKNSLLKNGDGTETLRLREMWSNVSSSEKLQWKRKANKIKKGLSNKESTSKKSRFLNKLDSNTRNAIEKERQKLLAKPTLLIKKKKPLKIKKKKSTEIMSIKTNTKNSLDFDDDQLPEFFKICGREPLDVADHLKLLGDNFCVIGNRLKEYNGQVVVSESLNILLESLMCSIKPFRSLKSKQQKLGIEHDKQLKQNLNNTLNNISYTIPGL